MQHHHTYTYTISVFVAFQCCVYVFGSKLSRPFHSDGYVCIVWESLCIYKRGNSHILLAWQFELESALVHRCGIALPPLPSFPSHMLIIWLNQKYRTASTQPISHGTSQRERERKSLCIMLHMRVRIEFTRCRRYDRLWAKRRLEYTYEGLRTDTDTPMQRNRQKSPIFTAPLGTVQQSASEQQHDTIPFYWVTLLYNSLRYAFAEYIYIYWWVFIETWLMIIIIEDIYNDIFISN